MTYKASLTGIVLTLLLAAGYPAHGAGSTSTGAGTATMSAPTQTDDVQVVGVLNSVDAAARTINVTHEPVEALGWPKMTMDLPVTRRVDLSNLKTGESVRFSLKQGRDKQFRVVAIEPLQ